MEIMRAKKRTTISIIVRQRNLLKRIFHRGTHLATRSLIVPLDDSPETRSADSIMTNRGRKRKMACSMNLVVNFADEISKGLMLFPMLYCNCSILTFRDDL